MIDATSGRDVHKCQTQFYGGEAVPVLEKLTAGVSR